jgi:hypothetical protein
MEPRSYLALEAIENFENIKPTDLILWDNNYAMSKESFEKWLGLEFMYEILSNKTTYRIITIIR